MSRLAQNYHTTGEEQTKSFSFLIWKIKQKISNNQLLGPWKNAWKLISKGGLTTLKLFLFQLARTQITLIMVIVHNTFYFYEFHTHEWLQCFAQEGGVRLAVTQQPITAHWCRHSLFLLSPQAVHQRKTWKLEAEIEKSS